MISISRGFLFIHIPKTAGNSIQNVLDEYSEETIVANAPHQDGVERFELSPPPSKYTNIPPWPIISSN